MKIPDLGFPQGTHPTTYEFYGWVRGVLNEGRYQLRILNDVPSWTTNDGEMVCVASGDTRALYVYISDGWYRLSWQQGQGGQYKTYLFHYAGVCKVGTSVSATVFLAAAGVISRVWAYVDTPPTGSGLTVDVTLNNTSIWVTNPGERVTIAAAANFKDTTTFDTSEVARNDYLRLDIDAVGSTVAGADLTVGVEVQE
jgi:hypothetical protein